MKKLLYSECIFLMFLGRWLRECVLAAVFTRVMRATVSIPAVASGSVLHSAVVGGSVVGVVRPL